MLPSIAMLTTKKRRGVFPIFLSGILAFVFCGCAPTGPRALLEGDRLLQEGKYSEAIQKFNQAAELLPLDQQRAVAWNRLGIAYQSGGDAKKAQQSYAQ